VSPASPQNQKNRLNAEFDASTAEISRIVTISAHSASALPRYRQHSHSMIGGAMVVQPGMKYDLFR
jgi:hypothetical protein